MTFTQCHTYLHHKNNKGLIISKTIKAKPIKFALKIVRLRVCMTITGSVTSTFIQGHKLLFKLQYLRQYFSDYIQTWHDGRLMDARYAHARFDDPDHDARSQWVDKGKQLSVACSRLLSKQSALNLLQR